MQMWLKHRSRLLLSPFKRLCTMMKIVCFAKNKRRRKLNICLVKTKEKLLWMMIIIEQSLLYNKIILVNILKLMLTICTNCCVYTLCRESMAYFMV